VMWTMDMLSPRVGPSFGLPIVSRKYSPLLRGSSYSAVLGIRSTLRSTHSLPISLSSLYATWWQTGPPVVIMGALDHPYVRCWRDNSMEICFPARPLYFYLSASGCPRPTCTLRVPIIVAGCWFYRWPSGTAPPYSHDTFASRFRFESLFSDDACHSTFYRALMLRIHSFCGRRLLKYIILWEEVNIKYKKLS
jgi:hypothetical protein